MHISNYKKYYFIDDFNPIHLKYLDRNITLIWRNKKKENDFITINKLSQFCKKNNIKLFLSNNVKLAIRLKLDGAYISAYNKNIRFNNFALKKNFKLIGSAHNLKEIHIKKIQNVKEIFISPIFKNKKNKALGIHKCKYFYTDSFYKTVALGGLNENNVKLLKLTNFIGFAAITIFKKKGPK